MESSSLAGFCDALSMGTWKRLSALVLGVLRTHLAGRRKLLRVTDAVSESEAAQCGCSAVDNRVSPALGITWANQLLMRLMVNRLSRPEQSSALVSHHSGSVRTLRVVFAPHLPPSFCYYTVKLEGVKGIK
ncbi:hypothetical protein Q9966_010324 [Columba livia]|nr:hypothetical protein Q9966_010324 [Columba livia]